MRNENADAGRSSEDDLWQHLREQFEDWWQEYGRTLVVVAVVAAAVLVSYNAYRKRVESDEAATWEALDRLPEMARLSRMNPQDADKERKQIVESCQKILESRWETKATPWVLLRMANAQRELERLEDAVAAFGRLREEHPASRAAEMAKAPLACTLEEMGQYAEAAEIFREIAEGQGEDSVHWLDVARNLELAGQIEEAQNRYRQLQENLDKSTDLVQAAVYRLKYLGEGSTLDPPPPPPPEEEPEGEEGTTEKQPQPSADENGQQTETETQQEETQGEDMNESPNPTESE